MPFADIYRRQVGLLIRTLPLVAREQCFALKGGTAINLFMRDMPRLSADIDLTYLLVQDRAESLGAIDAAMKRIAAQIKAGIRGAGITEGGAEGTVTKLMVRADGVQIKIEVTPVLRGCVYESEVRIVSEAVEDAFGFAEIQVVSFADLYAGKIVAALDRQHPRDHFDVRDLLANEGINDALRKAFIVYLLSHDRPMSEVLAPTRKDISQEFMRGFEGMTDEPVTIDELIAAREDLISDIVGKMPSTHRRFLLSFEQGQPEWSLLGLPTAAELPAVRWRQLNLNKLSVEKRAALVARLEERYCSNNPDSAAVGASFGPLSEFASVG
jgi:predicted nucleotidyltransferase component of viral defense system